MLTRWGRVARAWSSRGAVVVAALACMATSQARWEVKADTPAGAPYPRGAQGVLVTVEASQQPEVTCAMTPPRSVWDPSTPPAAIGNAEWHGHGDFFCPPGATLGAIRIGGHSGGGLCSKPTSPADAFVRIAHVESVATWSVATSSEPVVVHTGSASGDRYLTYDLLVASARSLHVFAEFVAGPDATSLAGPFVTGGRTDPAPGTGDGPDGGAVARDGGPEPRVRHYEVQIFPHDEATPGPLTASFVVHATAWGFCTTPGPCEPPPGETVRVLSAELHR